jgi:hypothetical protein
MTGNPPRKRRKAAQTKPASGTGPSDAASPQETPSGAPESAPAQEPAADSISAALKKARRR